MTTDKSAVSTAVKVRQFMIVSRIEFLPAMIATVGLPTFLAALSFSDIWENLDLVAWAMAVYIFAHLIGAQINCISDYDLDQGHKGQFPKAIDTLGRQTVVRSIIVEIVLATLIVLWLSIDLSRFQLLVLWGVGLALATAYSVEPLRLKKRGLLNISTLSLVLYGLPMSFFFLLYKESIEILPLIVLAMYSFQMAGIFLANEIEDYPEDKAMKVRNPCVRWGVKKASFTALLITTGGGVVIVVAFVYLLHNPYALLGGLLTFVGMYSFVLMEQYRMYSLCSRYHELNDETTFKDIIKLGSRLPTWVISLGVPLLIGSALTIL